MPAFRRLGCGSGGLWPGGCARLGGALRRVVRLLFAWAVVFSLAPAAVVAAVENGYCAKDQEITVKVIGGELKVKYPGSTVTMTGDAAKVFEGTIEV